MWSAGCGLKEVSLLVDWNKNLSGDFAKVFDLIKPLSPYGKANHRCFRLLRRCQQDQLQELFSRVELVRSFLKHDLKGAVKLRRLLKQLRKVDNHLDQIELGQVTDINLFELNRCCNLLNEITAIVDNSVLQDIIDTQNGALSVVLEVLKDGNRVEGSFYLANSYSQTLAELRKQLRHLERALISETQDNSRRAVSILGSQTKSVFTVSKHQQDIITRLRQLDNIELLSQTEHTIKFRVKDTEQIKELKAARKNTERLLRQHLQVIRTELGESLSPVLGRILQLLKDIGYLDTLLARAKAANELAGVRPEIVEENLIEISRGRHPILAEILVADEADFTPRTIRLPAGVSLITGINMGGKTVTLRLIQLLTLMVHAGMPVPAESMKIGLRDYVYFSRSDQDSILTGLSHFGQEVKALKTILNHKQEFGLVLIDEIAHGTSPIVGESLAIAVLEELHRSNCIVVVTTHYTGITEKVPVYEWQIKGLNYARWQDGNLTDDLDIATLSSCIDYNLEPVTEKNRGGSKALQIARLLGMDKKIVARAMQLAEESHTEKSLFKGE